MTDNEFLATRFEEHRAHLHAVAYRMLGSRAEADDAVQETWLRLSRSDDEGIENLGGWLTTVTARVSLNMLRSRNTRREVPIDTFVTEPVITSADDPEREALMADAVGLALLVVLERLAPAERLAFVLHDMFAVPFDDIAQILDRSPDAARQLASRARRRVRGAAEPDSDPARQREVVNAFFAAARGGDFEALVGVLDPDAVLRADGGERLPRVSELVRGAENIASRAIMFANPRAVLHPVFVNGNPGVVVTVGRQTFAVMSFTVVDDRIVAIEALNDPERLRKLDLSALG
ncbi:MAG TPA: RNA polymerase sigma factor SigJ [Solirubrobacteraceae bacterium]